MFRLPTHLESLVPPPRDQVPQSQPWRGAIFLPASSPPRPREILVTAAETENDNQQELWPAHLHLHTLRRTGLLRDVHDWLAHIAHTQPPAPAGQYPPRCILMPDRLPEQTASRENQAMFEAFALQLLEEDTVAIAQWSASEAPSHGGIVFYPTTTTRALLVGMVFLNQAFPDFIQGSLSHSTMPGPASSSSSRGSPGAGQHAHGGPQGYPSGSIPRIHSFQPVTHHSPYDPAPPSIASSGRYSASGFDASRGRSGRNSG